VTQAPDITLTVPEQETPVYIWVIVAIGALLVIAVIVLIIRTRRAE
jgi:Mg2+ and Co2+ transporter CorA